MSPLSNVLSTLWDQNNMQEDLSHEMCPHKTVSSHLSEYPLGGGGDCTTKLMYQSMNITVVKNGLTSVDVNMLEFLQVMDLGDSMRFIKFMILGWVYLIIIFALSLFLQWLKHALSIQCLCCEEAKVTYNIIKSTQPKIIKLINQRSTYCYCVNRTSRSHRAVSVV